MPRSRDDYTVACICPMGVELAPVQAMLDEQHPPIRVRRDYNNYTLGSIAYHNVVIAVLPEIGFNAASKVALQVMEDFPAIRFGLLVGLGGGVPDMDEEDATGDVRLGDIVVSKPVKGNAGVVQYDVEKYLTSGIITQIGALQKPPMVLLSTVETLAAKHRRLGTQIPQYLDEMMKRFPAMEEEYTSPGPEHDHLFYSSYSHIGGRTCRDCDRTWLVKREKRRNINPRFHYGTIASANMVIRDAALRDKLRMSMNVKCVEMEAAGLMESFPCLVVRGICDYADSHKNKKWQPYAAAVAAAYFRELLLEIVPQEVMEMARAIDVVQSANNPSEYELGLNLYNAPDIGDNLFVGRLEDLNELYRVLSPQGDAPIRQIAVLGGIGGMGKTQLAIAYAKRHRRLYSGVFWLNATTEMSLKMSLRHVVNGILPKSSRSDPVEHDDDDYVRRDFSTWFSKPRNNRWLLIFDNYDNPDAYSIQSYYPQASHGTIIVTTRRPNKVLGNEIRMQALISTSEALNILRTRSCRAIPEDDPDAIKLVTRLGGLPLALASAGTYLRNHFISFKDYLREYEKHWNLDPQRSIEILDYHPDRTLYTTWNCSFASLAKKDPDAAEMLKLLAYFDNQNIWYELLQAGIDETSPQWLIDAMASPVAFGNVMRTLVDYCFVDVHFESRSYSMHVCVHDWALVGLNSTLSSSSYYFASNCITGITRKDTTFFGLGHTNNSNLISHAVRLTHQRFLVGYRPEDESTQLYRNLNGVASLLHAQRQLPAAGMMYSRVLAAKEASLGYEHMSTISTVNDLGCLFMHLGKLAKAEELFMRALSAQNREHGDDNIVAMKTLNNLAALYWKSNKLDQAEQVCLRVTAGLQRMYGLQHDATLAVISSLARVYRDQGKLDAADQLFTNVLSSREKTLGLEHPTTLHVAFELGIVHLMKNELEKAEQMFSRAVAGFEKALGPTNFYCLRALRRLGTVYVRQERLSEAGTIFLRVLSGRVEAFGQYHEVTQMAAYRLSLVYDMMDEQEMAEQTLKNYAVGEKIKEVVDFEIKMGM